MTLFVIIPTEASTAAATAAFNSEIVARFGNASLKLPRGEWLVSYDGTSKQLSDELKISDGEIGVSAVVLAFGPHWGRASKAVWEWIALNQAKS